MAYLDHYFYMRLLQILNKHCKIPSDNYYSPLQPESSDPGYLEVFIPTILKKRDIIDAIKRYKLVNADKLVTLIENKCCKNPL